MFRALLGSSRGSSRDHHTSRRPGPGRPGRKCRPEVEVLEDRRVPAQVTNAVSASPITVDGQFSGHGEWLDVTPLSFLEAGGTLQALPTSPTPGIGNPLGNSFLYAALAPEAGGGLSGDLYLMYDEVFSGAPPNVAGSQLADITFPVFLNGDQHILTAHVQATGKIDSFFDVFFDIDGVRQPAGTSLDVSAAARVSPSPNAASPHLLVELEVGLRIPAGFASPGSPIPQAGINPATGLYDPDPQFWTGSFPPGKKDPRDPLGTSALFQIHPDGTVTANSDAIVSQVVKVRSPHPVNLKSNSLLPIEILSTATFDATKIDPSTVKVNGVSAPPRSFHLADVDGDGRLDLVLDYHVRDLVLAGALKPGDTSLIITALTLDGTKVGGSALLDIVPPF